MRTHSLVNRQHISNDYPCEALQLQNHCIDRYKFCITYANASHSTPGNVEHSLMKAALASALSFPAISRSALDTSLIDNSANEGEGGVEELGVIEVVVVMGEVGTDDDGVELEVSVAPLLGPASDLAIGHG